MFLEELKAKKKTIANVVKLFFTFFVQLCPSWRRRHPVVKPPEDALFWFLLSFFFLLSTFPPQFSLASSIWKR